MKVTSVHGPVTLGALWSLPDAKPINDLALAKCISTTGGSNGPLGTLERVNDSRQFRASLAADRTPVKADAPAIEVTPFREDTSVFG